ncbi:hypothetical protein AB0I35_29265 [Nocardia sp. NPDC050378]|uniref:hypothetical protein n=1 Tax=Nocardia sp. NPDC050378 TaxID=3155400 RepID=UPI0033C6844F
MTREDPPAGGADDQGSWWMTPRTDGQQPDAAPPTVRADTPGFGPQPPPSQPQWPVGQQSQPWQQPPMSQPWQQSMPGQPMPGQPMQGQPMMGQPQWQQPRPPYARSGSSSTPWLIGGAVVCAFLVLIVVAVVIGGNSDSDSPVVAAPTTTSSTVPSTYSTTSAAPTSKPFDWNSLDSAATDDTPLTVKALLPQSFTDSKGVLYTLRASGEHGCDQPGNSDNVSSAITSNGCTTNITGSYIDKDDHILVSVNVLVFPTDSAARSAYDTLDGQTQDWGIWCPTTGLASDTCHGDIMSATRVQWSAYSHRYFTQATGIYIDLSDNSSLEEWCKAGANAAATTVGPKNYWQK